MSNTAPCVAGNLPPRNEVVEAARSEDLLSLLHVTVSLTIERAAFDPFRGAYWADLKD